MDPMIRMVEDYVWLYPTCHSSYIFNPGWFISQKHDGPQGPNVLASMSPFNNHESTGVLHTAYVSSAQNIKAASQQLNYT